MNTKGTHGAISQDIKSFYDYVNNHIVTTDFTKQIDDEISYLKLDTKVRREFMLMEARLLDERREGIAEGKEIGLAEGEAIGLVKGEAEHKLKVAKLMLAKGCYSLQEITELSGLSLADVEKLKEEDLPFLCESAAADACAPGNPRPASLEQFEEMFRKLM